jgi:Ca2+-binding EF-hand superfamily protein
MKNLNYVGSLILVATVCFPINAHSEAIPDRGPIPFAAYDKDGDSLVSEKEFSAVRAERMSKRAADGRQMHGAASTPSFSEFDTNNDGQLTQDELMAGQKAQMEKRRSMGMGQGRGMNKGMGMGRNMPAFSEYDLNGDGKIPENEFNEARNKRISERAQQGYQMRNLGNAPSFADIDANGDGHISEAEFTTHQSQRRQQRSQ